MAPNSNSSPPDSAYPQELAFDEFGNLFTGDNNADGGDAARWVHLVEGGDSGWRIGYQYLKGLGVWNEERLWHTQSTNTAAYLLPPVAHIANGPSGLTYDPGVTLLPDKFAKHFFLCDFRGSGGGSGIHTFTVKAKAPPSSSPIASNSPGASSPPIAIWPRRRLLRQRLGRRLEPAQQGPHLQAVRF